MSLEVDRADARKATPWKEDASSKVVASNPCAAIFLSKSVTLHSYNHLSLEFVHWTSNGAPSVKDVITGPGC